MGMSGLPDIYIRSPGVAGLRAEGGEPRVHMV